MSEDIWAELLNRVFAVIMLFNAILALKDELTAVIEPDMSEAIWAELLIRPSESNRFNSASAVVILDAKLSEVKE